MNIIHQSSVAGTVPLHVHELVIIISLGLSTLVLITEWLFYLAVKYKVKIVYYELQETRIMTYRLPHPPPYTYTDAAKHRCITYKQHTGQCTYHIQKIFTDK